MKQEAVQLTKGALTAGGTMGGGIAVYLQALPVVISCFAIMCGAILSIFLAWKAYTDIQTTKKLVRAEVDDIKYRQDHALPCRRCTDKSDCEKENK